MMNLGIALPLPPRTRSVLHTAGPAAGGQAATLPQRCPITTFPDPEGFYEQSAAVLSPAILTAEELRDAHRLAAADPAARARLPVAQPLLVYVLPEAWHLADLPAEPYRPGSRGHETPAGFDRSRLKVLFTRPRTHAVSPTGIQIVRTAYGREPLVLVHLDLAERRVLSIDAPPPHVLWGDIPTPMY